MFLITPISLLDHSANGGNLPCTCAKSDQNKHQSQQPMLSDFFVWLSRYSNTVTCSNMRIHRNNYLSGLFTEFNTGKENKGGNLLLTGAGLLR